MAKLKNLDELNLDKRSKKKVQQWMNQWLSHLIEFADGREGNVTKADFQNMDFFYFTDCKDILDKDPHLEKGENQRKMRWRKSAVMLQLMLKSMLGQKLGRVLKCTHCGYEGVDTLYCNGGYWKWCPKCKRIIVDTYIWSFAESISDVSKQLERITNERET